MSITLLLLASTPMTVAQSLEDELFEIRTEESEQGLAVFFINHASFDITVDLAMDLDNLTTSAKLPFRTTLRGRQQVQPFELKIEDKGHPGKFGSSYRYSFGNAEAEPDTSYVYALPYAVGTSRKVVQSYFGSASHDESSLYAIDFKMPEGSSVHAAREGTVVGCFEDSNVGGPHQDFMKKTNYIFIRHDDLTIGAYYHLKQNGVKVRIGQRVARGEFIGYSGQTGFTFGPHLHFEVFKAENGRQRSTVPVKFSTLEGIIRVPVEGDSYTAN